MYEAMRLMGHTAAHAIWNISDSGGFMPLMQTSHRGGKRDLVRLVCTTSDEAIDIADKRIGEILNDADSTVNDIAFAYDAFFRIDQERFDALILTARTMACPASKIVMAIPYSWEGKGHFAVYKPKLVEWTECEEFDQRQAIAMFFEGVDSHAMGVKVWNQHMDQSK